MIFIYYPRNPMPKANQFQGGTLKGKDTLFKNNLDHSRVGLMKKPRGSLVGPLIKNLKYHLHLILAKFQ